MTHLNLSALTAAIAASGATLWLALAPAWTVPAPQDLRVVELPRVVITAPREAREVARHVELPRVVITAAREAKVIELPRVVITARREEALRLVDVRAEASAQTKPAAM